MHSAPAVAPPWQRLSWRVFSGTAALVLLLLTLVLGVATVGARRAARNSARQSLEQSADLVAQLLAGRGRSLGGGARVFVQGPYFRTLVAERRRDDILDQTFEAAEQLEASWVFITDDNGNLIAKSDEPSAFGEPMARVPLVSAALRGQITTGFGGSGDSVLFQATAVPIAAPGGMPFGVLVATRVLDSLTAADIALATNKPLLFFVLDEAGRARVAATSLASDTVLRRAVVRVVSAAPAGTASAHQEVVFAGQTWMLHRSILATAGGTPVGGYVVLQAADDALASMVPVKRSLFLAALIGLLGALAAARLTSRAVARPVAAMTMQVRQVVEQGGVPHAITDQAGGRALYVSAEVDALSVAVHDLVIEANDQDTVRALLAALPQTASDNVGRPKSGARTLAFRHTGQRAGGWTTGMLLAERYRLDEELGRGNGVVVFRAHDIARGEVVALRLGATVAVHEGREMPRIAHRHLVRLIDVGEVEGTPFVSFEFVDGPSLAELLAQHGQLDAATVAAIARQLLRGLSAMHAVYGVHGHITSSTVRLSRAGVVKLEMASTGGRIRRAGDRDGGQGVARDIHGARIGAPEYLAPELLIGGPPNAASDLYAIGVLLLASLTGETPFALQSPTEFLGSKLLRSPSGIANVAGSEAHVGEQAALPRPSVLPMPGVSPRHAELLPLVQQLMHPDATQRPQTVAAALDAWGRVGRIAAVNG